MKRKRISFLAMLTLVVILLMPASIQPQLSQNSKLTKITAVTLRSNIKKKHLGQQTMLCYKEAGNSNVIN